ncbi:proton-conducting transporter membrane subunit [Acidocella sp.]|uniref:proton-conducting transporter transmembrane domain-containing protein n=1 Tax=Acidocella sp. TaxID=50710 RepID=UPI00263104D0|nr:proton-conducting transporter membrane subunit [Acidocella sp.]
MNFALSAIALPLLAALGLGLAGTPRQGALANAGVCAALLALTLGVFWHGGGGLVAADRLAALFGVLTGLAGLTAALVNIGYVTAEAARMPPRRWRLYHALFQIVLGAALLGLYADNAGLLWAALEAGTIAMTLGVSLYRTPRGLEAAWKYFILGGVGIGLALFGTMLVYLAAQPALGPGFAAMSFAALSAHAAAMDGALLTLAFVFILFGYGTKAALVPLHGWLPDAYAEGPAPLTTALSGPLINVALLAILRFRHLMQANAAAGGKAMEPGAFLVTLGLASLFLAAFSFLRRRDARRFFGFSSIEHSGLAVFAFGIGGPAAIFGGILHMALHTLLKSGLFLALIRAASLRGSAAPGQYGFSHLRGLAHASPYTGWLLGGCVFALAGLPPSGLFVSEFIIVSQTIQRAPALSLPLGLGMLLCAVAVLRHVGPLLFARLPQEKPKPAGRAMHLVALHLGLMVLLAFAMPAPLVLLLSQAAEALR